MLRPLALLLLLTACGGATLAPGDASPMAGKRVEGPGGMVAAPQREAAEAGAAILRVGGNAIDAAVAAEFALAVVDISQTGLGGGGALTYYDARARRAEHLSFYNRTGEDPAWSDAERPGASAPGRAAATPGMVAGLLEAQARFGRLSRAQVIAPAIRLARDGFIVTPLLARTIVSSRGKLAADPDAFARFFPDGEALRPGDRLVQPALAATLERIAAEGRDGFYSGAVAASLVAAVRARGGLITLGDLERYPVATLRPVCAAWRGFTVLSAPPPMSGSPVLEMLQMAEASGLAAAGGLTAVPKAAVRFADIHRLATADAYRWRGDPSVMGVPARGVTSAGYAAERAALVGGPLRDTVPAGDPWPFEHTAPPRRCTQDPYPSATRATADTASDAGEGAESLTTHLAVIDADGNAVSATTTVGVLFGSGVYTGGFFLNSSAANLDDRTRGPNRYANSTIAPTVILDGTRVRLVVGAAGSQYIQSAIVQVTLRILAFGEDPWVAIAAPRLQASPVRRDVEVEPGFSSEVYAALAARGYRPLSRAADIAFGGVQAIVVRPDGRRIGVADPRRDGVVVRP